MKDEQWVPHGDFVLCGESGKIDHEVIVDVKNDVQWDLCLLYMEHLKMLIEKNKRYGDSALHPLGVFNKDEAGKGILIRLDDKLKRIKESSDIRKNDVADLMGYLALYCVSQGWVNFDDQVD